VQAPKKIRQTDAIFTHLAIINPEADRSDHVLRISMDAKAAVKIGCFSRGGKSRLERKAWDHDFRPETILTPFGILLPQFADLPYPGHYRHSLAITSLRLGTNPLA
jgi:hypothetical protein